MYEYKGTIKQVIDGDTLVVSVDLGFRITQTMVVRLYGVNAPEIVGQDKARGLAAKEFIEKWYPEGTEVKIQTYKDKKEKYGRYLAIVTLIKDKDGTPYQGMSLNALLLAHRLAEEYVEK